jgi:hypothetical protein
MRWLWRVALLLWLGACSWTATFNEKNYEVCLPLIESDRQHARAEGAYSYNPEDFNACRAPARYRNELREE